MLILSSYISQLFCLTKILDHSVPDIFPQFSSLFTINGVPQTELDGKVKVFCLINSAKCEDTIY